MAARNGSEVAFVEAPSELTGFMLGVHDSGSESAQDAEGRWIVRVPVPDAAALQTLLDRVQLWLLQERISEASIRVGGDVYRLRSGDATVYHTTEGSR
jgi:hypothetical protein